MAMVVGENLVNEGIKTVDTCPRIGYTIDSMANTPYRQLQILAKMCGVPRNLKKETLKMVIKAQMNEQYDEVERLLKQVREARQLRKNQRMKPLDNSKAMIKMEPMEENNNGLITKEETITHNRVRELLHKVTNISTARNVTIQKTSTHTHYRALITPASWASNKCFGISNSNSTSTHQNPRILSNTPSVIKYAHSTIMPNAASNQASSSTVPATTNQWCSPQSGYGSANNDISYVPKTASTLRETLMQQYHGNPVSYGSAQGLTANNAWTGGLMHCSNAIAYQPLPDFHSLPHNNLMQSNFQSYQHSQLNNVETELNEIGYHQMRPITSSYQGSQQCDRYYGGFENGIQKTSTPVTHGKCDEIQSFNYPSSINTPYGGASCPGGNRASASNVPYAVEAPLYNVVPGRESPGMIDVTSLSMESENIDTDLGLLANMAMTKAQEAIDETRNQKYYNGLLIIDDKNLTHGKNEPDGCQKSSGNAQMSSCDIPTWNNFLEQMATNLSPEATNKMPVSQCKYGCPATASTREQQQQHEAHCLQQPMQCPHSACAYVGQLRSITTHLLNDHYNEIKSNGCGSYLIDFTDGVCSFDIPRSWLKKCPKKFNFYQLVEGRLFIIKVIGNFDNMQAAVYVQYVNDYMRWKSQVAMEVLRPDGVPHQYRGEILPLSYNPMHILSRQKCLVFNMNREDWTQNLFMLHIKIHNTKL